MATLTAEKLLSALPRTADYTITTEGPLAGETVTVRVLDADRYAEWLATTDQAESRVLLLAGGIADPEITPDLAEKLGGLEAPLLVELTNAVLAFNGFLVGGETGKPFAEATGDSAGGTFPAKK